MVLNFGGRNIFDNSREEKVGLYGENKSISSSAVKSFHVGGPAEQYLCTTSFAEVTGMSVEHESKTGKVLVLYSCEIAPGTSEYVKIKLQKDGVDVEGTQVGAYVNAEPGSTVLSIAPAEFQGGYPDTSNILLSSSYIKAEANNITMYAPVNLPHGAVVTAAKVYGAASGETWTLNKYAIGGTSGYTLGSANIGTEDTSISNATIDNLNYKYTFKTSSLDDNDIIYGARIKYTPSRWSFQAESPFIPATIHKTDINAEKNTWRIVAKTSDDTVDDCHINDRILTIIDI